MWRCSACGTENSDNSQNCRHCQQPRPEPKPQKSGKWALLAACAAALALVIGGVTFFTGREADKPEVTAPLYTPGPTPSVSTVTEAPVKNKCGENAFWTLENGTLTISGSGAMEDYIDVASPWIDIGRDIRKVIIEDGITSVGSWAFENCESFTRITLPDSVTKIGPAAFMHCTGLTSVTLPDGVTDIANNAFAGCTGLTDIILPEKVIRIGAEAFTGCESLTHITIPNSVTEIGAGAFQSSGLTGIEIPNGVAKISDGAFWGCGSLTSVTIPDGVREIEASAFRNCGGLSSITIPDSVTEIGAYVFEGCDSLTICTPEGSYAQSYAREHKIPYKLPGSDRVYAYDLTATVRTSDTTGYNRVRIADAIASSELYSPDTKLTYYASNALDGDLSTCWQEGGEGYGIGEYIELYLENETGLSALTFDLGNTYDQAAYDRNGRPSELEISFSDGSSVICQFPDRMTEYMVELSNPVYCSSFRVSIRGAYGGNTYQDTCIAEIRAFSKAS